MTRDREETEIRPADQAGACVASDADGQAQTQPQPSDRIAPLRTFEEFNDQRKAAFLKVKDFKQADGRLVGYLCSSTPLETIDAAGASAERLAEYEAGDSVVARVATLVLGSGGAALHFLTGGLCDNGFVVGRLAEALGSPVETCAEARYAGALGATLMAAELG